MKNKEKYGDFAASAAEKIWAAFKDNALKIILLSIPPALLFSPVLIKKIPLSDEIFILPRIICLILSLVAVYVYFCTVKAQRDIGKIGSHRETNLPKISLAYIIAAAGIALCVAVALLPNLLFAAAPSLQASLFAYQPVFIVVSVMLLFFLMPMLIFFLYGIFDGSEIPEAFSLAVSLCQKNITKVYLTFIFLILIAAVSNVLVVGFLISYPLFNMFFSQLYIELRDEDVSGVTQEQSFEPLNLSKKTILKQALSENHKYLDQKGEIDRFIAPFSRNMSQDELKDKMDKVVARGSTNIIDPAKRRAGNGNEYDVSEELDKMMQEKKSEVGALGDNNQNDIQTRYIEHEEELAASKPKPKPEPKEIEIKTEDREDLKEIVKEKLVAPPQKVENKTEDDSGFLGTYEGAFEDIRQVKKKIDEEKAKGGKELHDSDFKREKFAEEEVRVSEPQPMGEPEKEDDRLMRSDPKKMGSIDEYGFFERKKKD